ncbi:MFS transporter [Pseudoclavibacter sp. RFBJ3]|uniref:MFS transporter n=1 Tax=unclassified Pseudoclavibacter TaxID=2615177 RepID=UPI000CE87D63|nr:MULTISPECIES: MFS transporter [unclassified Pseudoclavibacter]PPF87510.1 MFS transporter [Pseudoclavibacter sp. RFBJ5]PPF90360.1 MFS transporter [Pseudoclavibacter sp. RFBJ3]PPG01045.1 MFS transporter [Pseudoclavibacter sp. RFBH5]PPG26148.1 MFS transporter [Pseudoclavibacter sp. RFBI4]
MTQQSSLSTSPPEAALKVPHRWRNLATLTGVTVVDNTEAGMINTLFPSIAAALRLDNSGLGVIAALGKIIAVPAGPFWVWLATKIGRRAALVLTTVLGGAFGIATGFSQDFVQLAVLATLMAACLIGGSPIANAVIADSFSDRERGKAAGLFYGGVNAIASFVGPLIALFTGITDGWRFGMWALGGLCLVAGLMVWVLFRDPGVGASDGIAAPATSAVVLQRTSFRRVLSLFAIPTFSVMMISRLLSGHLLITIFGIQFLVTERGFDNATAAIVLIPFGIGYIVGTVGGGFTLPTLDRIMGLRGRVFFMQLAQLVFAVAAYFGTQIVFEGILAYGVFWALMGLGQGMNPPVNRPIVSSVVPAALRGQAFAIWLTGFETVAWAIFSLGAGQLADTLGLQQVFLYVLVGSMLLNALLLTVLYRTYPRDVARVAEAQGLLRA